MLQWQRIMKQVFNNWKVSVAALIAVAVPALFCSVSLQTQADSKAQPETKIELPAGQHALFYPTVLEGTNIKDQPLVIVGVTAKDAKAPEIMLDGKAVKNMPLALAEFGADWAGYTTHFYGHTEGKTLGDLDRKQLFVASIPMVPPGDRTLSIDGKEYKFKKVTAKDKTVKEAYSHHSPFKIANKTGILPFKCEECHKVTEEDGKKILGFAGTENCRHCHKDLSNHKHDMETLAKCNMCHDPHASVISKRLLNEKDKLCTQCHEARTAK